MPAASRAVKTSVVFVLLVRHRQQLGKRIKRLLRKTLKRIVIRDDGHSLFIVADFKEPQQVADIILIVKLCADSHCQALHRE